jgi:DNA-directed RNA polymerase alpha subunit
MARRTKDTKEKWDTYLHDRCRHVWEKLTPQEKEQYKKLAEKDLFRFLKEFVRFQNEKEDENQEDAEDEKKNKKDKELKKTFRYNGKICRFSDFEKELEMIKREVLKTKKTNKKSLVQKKNQKSKKREEEDGDEVVELSSDMEE